jgi:hypothetical protein
MGTTWISWDRKRTPIPPGTKWYKKIFWPLEPLYEGEPHGDVTIGRIGAASPEMRLPQDFEGVFREELRQGFMQAGYQVLNEPPQTADAALKIDIDVLRYDDPGFLAASLQPFTSKCLLKCQVTLSKLDDGEPFARGTVERSAPRPGLMAVAIHAFSTGMGDIIKCICTDLPLDIKKHKI